MALFTKLRQLVRELRRRRVFPELTAIYRPADAPVLILGGTTADELRFMKRFGGDRA